MFHANGWTFIWIVTAVGGDARLPAQGRPAARLRADRAASTITMLCAAPTVLIGVANAPAEVARAARRAACGSSPPARRRRPRRSSGSRGSSAGTITHVYGLTETAPFITVCEPRPEHAGADAARSAPSSRRARASS